MKKEVKEEKEIKKTTKKDANKHEVVTKIDGEAWTKALDKAFVKKQKETKVDGFRTGKVPRDVYEKHFGKESLYLEAAESMLQEAYSKALTESKLIPAVEPSVDLKSLDESGVEYVFKIITKPELKIKKYKGLGVKKEEVNVTKEEIEHEIAHLLEKYTELVTKDGKIVKGDVAIIDFEGSKDGVPFDGGKAENYSLEIGSNSFIPGFEDALIGMAPNEEKDIKLTFPKDYQAKDLAGKEVTFKVKVHEIKTKETRKLDEEFFEDLGMDGVTDEATLKKEVEASLKAQKDVDIENKHVDKLLEEIAKNVEVDIPEEMVNEETNRLLEKFEQNLKMQGVSLDLYYQFTKSDEATLKSQMEKEAYSNVLYRLMLEEIMNLEEIEVTPEEASQEAEDLAKKYNMEKEEFLKQFGGLDMIQYDLEMRKTIELLKDLNK